MRRGLPILGTMALLNIWIAGNRPAHAQERNHTLTGTFRTHVNFHSKYLAKERNILVYLPPGYESNTQERYPVLYMHDGQNLFDGATSFIPGKEWRMDETANRLILSGDIRPLIIVGIYNAGAERLNEYTPTATTRFQQAGKADAYGKMLVEELKPLIDGTYRTMKGAMDTAIGGSSLGGLVSLYLAMKHPHVFGKALVVSPSIWWDDRFLIKHVQALKARPRLQVWLDMGTQEGDPKSAPRNVTDARLLRDALIGKGWRENLDLKYLEAEGALHDEAAWGARVEPMLCFLFSKR